MPSARAASSWCGWFATTRSIATFPIFLLTGKSDAEGAVQAYR